MTVFPSDVTRPVVSDLNYVGGAPATPNKVDVKLSADGRVSLYNLNGSVDLVADVVGYYTHQRIQDILAQLATKANAADVYTKANIDLALLRRQTFVGRVNTNGTKAGTGSYTSSTSATGVYWSCTTSPDRTFRRRWPRWSSSPAMADWSTFNSVNGFLTTMEFAIRTTVAGSATNCGFNFIATFLGSDTIAIPVPSVAAAGGASPSVAATGSGNVVCVNDKRTAVCS